MQYRIEQIHNLPNRVGYREDGLEHSEITCIFLQVLFLINNSIKHELDSSEKLHYQKIVVALTETDRLMKEIDTIEIE